MPQSYRGTHCFLSAALCVLSGPSSVCADVAACKMRITSAFGAPGQTVRLCLLISSDLPVKGLSAAFQVDPKLSLKREEIIVEAPPGLEEVASFNLREDETCVALGIITDFSSQDIAYPKGGDVRVLVMPFRIDTSAQAGERLWVSFQKKCGSPPIQNFLVQKPEVGQSQKCTPQEQNLVAGWIDVVSQQGPPEDLKCTLEGKSVKLSWKNVGTYKLVEILRNGEVVAQLPGDTTQHSVTGLECSESYTFQVKAYADCLGYEPIGSAQCENVTVTPCCPDEIHCRAEDGLVQLSWLLCDKYDAIKVIFDGLEAATLPGEATSYGPVELGCGEHQFTIVAVCGTESCDVGCSVKVEPVCPTVIEACACGTVGCSCEGEYAANDVRILWANHGPYEALSITEIDSSHDPPLVIESYAVSPDSKSWVLRDVPPGIHTYQLVASCGDMQCHSDEITVEVPEPGTWIYVGEVNGDGKVDIADAVSILSYLFGGGPAPGCMKAADTNDDDSVDIADAINLLGYLFSDGGLMLPDGTEVKPSQHPGCTLFDATDIPDRIDGLPACREPCK